MLSIRGARDALDAPDENSSTKSSARLGCGVANLRCWSCSSVGGPIYLFAGYAITFALGDVVYQTSLAIATTFELKDYIYM